MSDFVTTVKPAFDFLGEERGYELLDEHVADSFDNGLLLYQSAVLRIRITRDRGQVICDVRARGDDRDIDQDILRLQLDGARRYVREAAPVDFSPTAVAEFLRRHLAEIEQRFTPPALTDTLRTAKRLMGERAEQLLGWDRKA